LSLVFHVQEKLHYMVTNSVYVQFLKNDRFILAYKIEGETRISSFPCFAIVEVMVQGSCFCQLSLYYII